MNTQSRSLEWFFRTPSAANFPQASSSTALAKLSSDYGRMVPAFLAAAANLSQEEADLWLEPSDNALKLKVELNAEFTPEMGTRLIDVLSEVGRRIKQLSGTDRADVSKVNLSFRMVLADLIVLAKESNDASFKQKVLGLIENFA